MLNTSLTEKYTCKKIPERNNNCKNKGNAGEKKHTILTANNKQWFINKLSI